MWSNLTAVALAILARQAPPEPSMERFLELAGLTESTARFDPNIVGLFRTGEFTSSYYAACDQNPWRLPFFAATLRAEIVRAEGKPSDALAASGRLLGVSVRRTLLDNPNKDDEAAAQAPGALAALLNDWKARSLATSAAPSLKDVPIPVQNAAALILRVAERTLAYRKLAFASLGDLAPVYRALSLSGEDGSTFFDLKRRWYEGVDVAYLLAGAHDLALAGQTASEWLKAVPSQVSYDVKIETVWGDVRLSGGGASRYAAGNFLMIVDTGGDDVYVNAPATRSASNWASIVLDTAGNDKYVSAPELEAKPVAEFAARKDGGKSPGPGGALLGIAVLIDSAGNDLYRSHIPGIASATLGASVLLDKEGSDVYDAYADSQAYAMFGFAVLEDLAGADTYLGFTQIQAIGQTQGAALLLDRAGNDRYDANDAVLDFPSPQSAQHNVSMAQGAGNGERRDYLDGHSLAGGVGILFDAAGDDAYRCGVFGQGVGYWQGVGMLWDGGGNDAYEGQWYAQAASAHYAIGYLEDLGGNDTYTAPMNMAQGAGHDFSVGYLLDHGGNDKHQAPNLSLGAGNANGIGVFVDLAGDDAYESSGVTLGKAAEAAAGSLRERAICLGVFLDLGGTDVYPASAGWAKNGANAVQWTARRDPVAESQVGVFLDRQ